MYLKKKVNKIALMWAPSWSASDKMMILSYFKSSMLKSSPQPVSRAVKMERISSLLSTLSIRERSTLSGLPRSGKIAWKRRFLPDFALPPALSPSTINNSFFLESLPVQLASLPISVVLKMLFFWRVTSLALRAASLTFAEAIPFLMMVSAMVGAE